MHVPVTLDLADFDSSRVQFETVDAVFTCGDHCSASGIVVLNGVRYNYHAHLFLRDGVWNIREDDRPYLDKSGVYPGTPSDSARKKFKTVAVPALAKAIVDSDCSDLLVDAEVNSLTSKHSSAAAKVKKLEEELSKAQADLADAFVKLQKAKVAQ